VNGRSAAKGRGRADDEMTTLGSIGRILEAFQKGLGLRRAE
jgi:hypothetical protein